MRNKKISADISVDAKAMLDAYSVKHERSKGWLLDRMIRRYCSEIEITPPIVKTPAIKKTSPKRFTPPSVEEVFNYCNERCNNVDAQSFVDHYSGIGWMRGKNKIKDWRACVRTWEKNNQSNTIKAEQNLGGNW